ncbi:riboflavin biosynthesis protein RibD [Nocardia yunnanensis]|uniref:Riboflavin biosynthesis protein RibD n=1 Tax=Nocardia yunnanensis TaxID=2382165 RepID=A0A386ZGA4_9NOCA|nr:dihydrofolate reductase family protein [Nocardia yunnanensis]AYF76263.1 riboflavin biosynthesis protein RibD [Nocardia yunnanensis]
MQILARLCISADGYVTTPNGWPPQVLDPVHGPGSHGIAEFLQGVEAAVMGRTTFEPALTNDRWPWPGLRVFVLGSHRPEGTPEDVVVEPDPERLLERLRAENRGGDVHLIGGPSTVETFRALGVLDKLELVVLPFLVGSGMRLTDSLSTATGLEFESSRALAGGSVEIVYRVRPDDAPATRRPDFDARQPQRP